MIDDLKPYPEYKESGLPWLHGLAPGWRTLRGKGVFSAVDARSETGKEELLTVSASDGVLPRRQKTVTMFMAKSYIGHKLCWPGDVVVNSLWAWMQGLGVAQHHGLISSAYSVYRPRCDFTGYARFFHYLLRSAAYRWELQTRSKGVWLSRLQLSDLAFMDMPIVLPPPEAQAAIVRFLDHANGRIERFIRAKRKLIALLNEQKQAIIHRAVTRGLDPHVKLKPSGIPWLGDVPEHWEMLRLGRIIRLITGFPFPSARFSQNAQDTRLLRGINVTPSGIRWESVVRWKHSANDEWAGFQLIPGDIVLGMDRPIVSRGVRAALVETSDTPCLLLQRVARLRTTERLDGDYLLMLLRGQMFSIYIAPIFTGISVPHLSPEQIKGFTVVVPPFPEQKTIVIQLQSATSGIDTAIARTERELTLIREYRTRLVRLWPLLDRTQVVPYKALSENGIL